MAAPASAGGSVWAPLLGDAASPPDDYDDVESLLSDAPEDRGAAIAPGRRARRTGSAAMGVAGDRLRRAGASVSRLQTRSFGRVHKAKARLFYLVTVGAAYSPGELLAKYAIMSAVVVGTLSVMTETVVFSTSPWQDLESVLCVAIEIVVSIVLAIEYGARIWACTIDESLPRPKWRARLTYAAQPKSLFDLMLVLPLPIYLVTDSTVQIFGFTWPDNGEAPTFVDKVLFYIRLLRLLKVSRYSTSLRRLGAVLRLKGGELATSVMLGSVVVVFLSVIVYFCELGGEGNLLVNLPQSVYWGVITLTTVGYGDLSPKTPLGRFFSCAGALLGIGLFTLPSSIIASGYQELEEAKVKAASDTVNRIFELRRLAECRGAFARLRMLSLLHAEGGDARAATQRTSSDAGSESDRGGRGGVGGGADVGHVAALSASIGASAAFARTGGRRASALHSLLSRRGDAAASSALSLRGKRAIAASLLLDECDGNVATAMRELAAAWERTDRTAEAASAEQ